MYGRDCVGKRIVGVRTTLERALLAFKRFEGSDGDGALLRALHEVVDGMSPEMWRIPQRQRDRSAYNRLLLYSVRRAEVENKMMMEELGKRVLRGRG